MGYKLHMQAGGVIQLEDGQGHQVLAVLAPTGKVIVSVATTDFQTLAHVELQPEQAERLGEFLGIAAISAL